MTTILCDLCGGERGQPVTVYACTLHGRCSARRQHSQVRSCLACADFTA
jgi:hypothetical protein